MESACGVEDDYIVTLALGVPDGVLCDLDGIFAVFAIDVDVYLLAEDNQLLDSGRSSQVVGYQKRSFAFFDEVFCEFCGGCGFSAALEAGQQDYGWAGRDEIDAGIDGAHQSGQLVAYNFYQDLAGVEALYDLGSDGGLCDIRAELLYDVVVDVGFQEGLADIAHSIGDVGLGDSTSAGQRPED